MNNTIFYAGKSIDLTQPNVMGIINLAPESFSSVGRCLTIDEAIAHGVKLAAQGATIIDIGGEPTHPKLNPVTPEDLELQRVIPVVSALSQELSIPISVDTSKPKVIEAVLAAGANLINDVRALQLPGALEIVAEAQVPVCLMHMRYPYGVPKLLPANQKEENIVNEVKDFLQERINCCLQAGIKQDNLIVDPGIGHGSFGKSTRENLLLLKHMHEFKTFDLPLLVGTSRKTFIGELFDVSPEYRLPGSLASALMAIRNGADIIRVHDVAETVQALRMMQVIEEAI